MQPARKKYGLPVLLYLEFTQKELTLKIEREIRIILKRKVDLITETAPVIFFRKDKSFSKIISRYYL